jgi:hypothetical protein
MRAPQAAGVIHGDFEKNFIRAETIGCGGPRTLTIMPLPHFSC